MTTRVYTGGHCTVKSEPVAVADKPATKPATKPAASE